ncbi:MAG: lipid-binding SYLF domain-containing protein [Planctomycetia bacterium]|nr:lipid-binding SYLF domain-containing protein [Planctomycetia bacterium]
MFHCKKIVGILGLLVVLSASGVWGSEQDILRDSRLTLQEIMKIPAKSIPASLFQKAEGMAIFPAMVKGGFIVGVQRGEGVLVVKNKEGVWENPRFASLTGGSLGFQAGVQRADVVLVFCSRRSVEAALEGRFTVGADATVTAGPVGRQATAATDWKLKSEIYSYSRSRGIFLGAAIDGSVLEIHSDVTNAFYQNGVPDEAKALVDTIVASAGANAVPPSEVSAEPVPLTPNDKESVRLKLVEANAQLQEILEEQWKVWLALPAEVYEPEGKPSVTALQFVWSRFETVMTDPKYQALREREEFIQTRELLKTYMGL